MAHETETSAMAHDRSPVWVIVASTVGLLLVAVALLGLTVGWGDAPGHQTRAAAANQVASKSVFGTELGAVRSPITTPPARPKYRHPPGASRTAARSSERLRGRGSKPPTKATSAAQRHPKPAPQPAPPKADLAPAAIRIPAIGVASPLVRLGLNPDHTLQVPTDFGLAGWYIYRPVPGEIGPAVIAGHVDSKVGPAVFYRLKDLQPGAIVEVDRNDGSAALFTVTSKEEVSKNAFPTERVYGPTTTRELRLITCAGSFNFSSGHYNDNLIVFAKLAKIVR